MKTRAYIFLLSVGMTGCMMGPNFKSPAVQLPPNYIYDTLATHDSTYVVSQRWWDVFGDTTLNRLITTTIAENKNLAIALSHVEQARLKARSAKAEMLPSISLNVSAKLDYNSTSKLTQEYAGMLGVTWDIDLFGKLRRIAESAKAQYLSSEYGRRATLLALTAEVATNYFALLQYQQNLEIARQTYQTRTQSTAIIDSMFQHGMSSLVDLEQARASAQTAKVSVEQYDRSVKYTMLALNLLLSQNPSSVVVSRFADSIPDITIPAGLPSSLLERRPDVMQAYYSVAAANATIGAAIANRIPSISLTGQGGLIRNFERDLISGLPLGWSAAGSLVEPLLNWGNNKRAVDIAREQTKTATLTYQQTALTAINEVEQALVAIDTYRRQLNASRELLRSAQSAQYLTKQLYVTGSNSYLDLLDADRTLFSAQSLYWQTVQEYLTAYVTLYKALGGGW